MLKKAYSQKFITAFFLVSACVFLLANFMLAVEGNLLTQRSVSRWEYFNMSFYAAYGICTLLTAFYYRSVSESKTRIVYCILGAILAFIAFLLQNFIHFYYEFVSAGDSFAWEWVLFYQFPAIIFLIVSFINGFYAGSTGHVINTPIFFLIGLAVGLIAVFSSLSVIVANGYSTFGFDVIASNACRVVTCCLAMSVIYHTGLVKTPSDSTDRKLKLPVALKIWFALCLMLHFLLAGIAFRIVYFPDFTAVALHLSIAVGLGFLIFNNEKGWPLFTIPILLLFITQIRMLTVEYILFPPPNFDIVQESFLDYPETIFLAVEIAIILIFVRKK